MSKNNFLNAFLCNDSLPSLQREIIHEMTKFRINLVVPQYPKTSFLKVPFYQIGLILLTKTLQHV